MTSRVILIPQSGYANKLRALASSSLMARELDASLEVYWPESETTIAGPSLFGPDQFRFIESNQQLKERTGMDCSSIPIGLTSNNLGLISLSGGQFGEQRLMKKLKRVLPSGDSTLLISSGGAFGLTSIKIQKEFRSHFYKNLRWAEPIEEAIVTSRPRTPYLGLHARSTDLANDVASNRSLLRGIKKLRAVTGLNDVWIAADTLEAREFWIREINNLGLSPIYAKDCIFGRSGPQGARDAMVDFWRLYESSALVYSRKSSFGEEASLANPHRQLVASKRRISVPSLIRDLGDWARKVLHH